LVSPPDYIILKQTTEEKLDQQQKFINEVIAQIEDILCDAEYDLGQDSVLYIKAKDLLSVVEEYQESL
jgi:hypothetical protein